MTITQLREAAQEINRNHKEAQAGLEQYRAKARQVGRDLIEVKAALPHGEWLTWLQEFCPDITERTAQHYMAFARGDADTLSSGGRRIKSESDSDLGEGETGTQDDEPEDDEPRTGPVLKPKKAKRKKKAAKPESEPEVEEKPKAIAGGWVDPASRIDEAIEMFRDGISLKKIAKKLRLAGVAELSEHERFTDAANEIRPGTFSKRNSFQMDCGRTPSALERIQLVENELAFLYSSMYTLVESDREKLLAIANEIIRRDEQYGKDR